MIMHSTLALRKQKEKKDKVTHPTITLYTHVHMEASLLGEGLIHSIMYVSYFHVPNY